MLPRFLAPDLDPDGLELRLPADESRHLVRVLRLGPGARVAVFDGRGNEFVARVTAVGPDVVTTTLVERVEPAAEPRVPFSLVQAVLKGASMDEAVRDAVMMGASRIEPIVTVHTAVKPGLAKRPETLDRWRRIAVSSVKQCRRATVPIVSEARTFQQWLESSGGDLKLMFVEPAAASNLQSLRSLMGREAPERAALIVGPEGGWAPEEIEAAVRAGCMPVTLGSLTLRADAVPVAALSVFRFLWES
jgi:16S rRNA (uracil1498-N3)-methyltransferase